MSVDTSHLARLFKALSDPNRLEILWLIRERCGSECRLPADRGSSVTQIAECFDLSLSTVSHHIKELRNAGLLTCEKRGQWVHCAVNEEALALIAGQLSRPAVTGTAKGDES